MGIRIPVPIESDSYDIILGHGTLATIPSLLEHACPAAAYAVLADTNVARLYGHDLATAIGQNVPCYLFHFPAGEWNKTRETWGELSDQMLRAPIGRDGAVIALGGGVAGDLAGFVAATYLRGIPYVQVPTTLLAMIDSSIGGKTGVDTAVGKNLIGAFHQPKLVVADVGTLQSLPKHQMAAGVAEAIKHGAIADPEYLEALVAAGPEIFSAQPETMIKVVRRSIEIKAAVVTGDVKEAGKRAILNAGHTVGHALEAVYGYQLLHGEAVALGLVSEARIGIEAGITKPGTDERLQNALEALRLPLEFPTDRPVSDLIEAMRYDKKNRAGAVRFSLLAEIGKVAQIKPGNWTHEVDETIIESVLSRTA